MKRVLLLSDTSLDNDLRVRRQLMAFKSISRLTYVGKKCDQNLIRDARFIDAKPIDLEKRYGFHHGFSWPLKKICSVLVYGFLFVKKQFKSTYFFDANARAVYRRLKSEHFDVIYANDLETLQLAVKLKGLQTKLIFDAHEYFFDEHIGSSVFVNERLPVIEYVTSKYFKYIDVLVSVCDGIAQLYQQRFYFDKVEVITNAKEYADHLSFSETTYPIQMIHHGYYKPNRNIEALVDMMQYLPRQKYALNLMIVGSLPEKLLDQINGLENVHLIDAVQADQIVDRCNAFDVGVMAFKPVTENLRYVLPNKFFEFIQARLAIVSGPSIEVEKYVHQHGLGVIAQDFDGRAMAQAVLSLDAHKTAEFKQNTHLHAEKLSASKNINQLKALILQS